MTLRDEAAGYALDLLERAYSRLEWFAFNANFDLLDAAPPGGDEIADEIEGFLQEEGRTLPGMEAPSLFDPDTLKVDPGPAYRAKWAEEQKGRQR